MTPVPPALSRSGLDRAAHLREDPALLEESWADPRSRVLVLDDELRVAVEETDGGTRLRLGATADVAHPPVRLLLGLGADGAAYWAVTGTPPRSLGTRLATLRDVGAHLGDRDAGMLVQAVALANWHATHPRCPRCGTPTRPERGGYVRRCPADGTEHFPRTDPAVIMLVHDGGERCVLGRQPTWPPGRYSTLAGFVEPGESLEQAVAREVAEEVGLLVHDVGYVASQPWPFPSSLMLGFTAQAEPGEPRVGDAELEDARWFSRDELRRGVVLLPPPVSIAYRLVTDWMAG